MEIRKLTGEAENLAASMSGITASLYMLARNLSSDRESQKVTYLLAEYNKILEEEAYKIFETLRGVEDVTSRNNI